MGRLLVPRGLRGDLEPLQQTDEQEIHRELLCGPGLGGGLTLRAQELGVRCLLPLQTGHAESVLAGQDLG